MEVSVLDLCCHLSRYGAPTMPAHIEKAYSSRSDQKRNPERFQGVAMRRRRGQVEARQPDGLRRRIAFDVKQLGNDESERRKAQEKQRLDGAVPSREMEDRRVQTGDAYP